MLVKNVNQPLEHLAARTRVLTQRYFRSQLLSKMALLLGQWHGVNLPQKIGEDAEVFNKGLLQRHRNRLGAGLYVLHRERYRAIQA